MDKHYRTLLGARSWRNKMLTSERAEQSDLTNSSSRGYAANSTTFLDLLEDLRRGFSRLFLAK